MTSGKTSTAAAAALLLLAWMPAAPAAGAQEEEAACTVEITTPKPGDQVGRSGKVRGKARIPSGTHLWVMAHMKDLVLEWWPQGGRPAVVEDGGEWVIIAGYGAPEDVGELFEVSAVVVDANTNRRLLDWVKTAQQTGEYPPIPLPTPVDACVPVKVVIEKVSH
jgi:hypothetical protein